MPDLLLELFSEEIPARMQAKAADDLKRLVTGRLVDAGLVYEGAKAFATPRRLALSVQGIPVRQPDLKEEKKGPRVGAPDGAIQGFLKGAGLSSLDQASVQKDPKKGDFYVALVEKPGRPAIDVLAEILPVVIRTFPWPKAMRWGARSQKPGALAWVRPLHSIVATFGPETEDPDIVPFSIDGIEAGDVTHGHRFMAPRPFKVRRLDDYAAKLETHKVVLDADRRAQTILADARTLAFAQGYELVEDAGLLAEVAGLVEWPVALMGTFDASFLAIPQEVIRTTIRANQKCFVLRDSAGALANKFVLVANIEAEDGGAAIVAGNERVIRARLSDAKFFYETDLKTRLEARLPKFEHIVFHEKLGTQAARIARIEALAVQLAPLVGADVETTRRAARLCKADLLTEVVGEFPELQGLMGKYYARAQGEDEAVAQACEDHYKPLGPSDRVPTDPVAVAVALADKLDTLVGFWAIDEKPTGSKDPYALRRAALGVIRLVLENALNIELLHLIRWAFEGILYEAWMSQRLLDAENLAELPRVIDEDGGLPHFDSETRYAIQKIGFEIAKFQGSVTDYKMGLETFLSVLAPFSDVEDSLLFFFAERLKVQLREQGARHDLVDAVFAQQEAGSAAGATGTQNIQDDLLLIVRRVEALGRLLDTDDGRNLLVGYRRAANILRIEEKKDAASYVGAPDPALYRQAEEWELARAIDAAKSEASAAVVREDFEAAMGAIARLRPHVDAYFDKVTVNADDAALRANRLKLLNEIREATRAVADFSKIEG